MQAEKQRNSKMQDLQSARQDLQLAQQRMVATAAEAEYSFESCTLHVERLPDSFGQTDAEALFSLFGRVLQVTLRRRPGTNSNWALVTMAGASCVRACLIAPRRYVREPNEEQARLIRRFDIIRCHSMYESGYGHSWLEAQERADATVRGLAKADERQLRNDFGVFVTTKHTVKDETSAQAMVPRRRARVCERRRQIAAQMRACEMSVDAMFYAHDRDNSGALDREELGVLMAALNGGSRVSEFSVQFVLDQVKSHGDGQITREQLKPAIVLWRYLQHEQDFVAKHFDEFDVRTRGKMIGKNEVGLLLKKLNSDPDHPEGISPAVAEVDWVMNRARGSNGDANVERSELRAAVALWYPFVYNRRRVEDLPSSMQKKVGRTRKAVAGMLGVHKHHVSTVLKRRYPSRQDPENPGRELPHKLTDVDLGDIASEMVSTHVRREKVGQDVIEYLASTADLQGADNFEPEDIHNALAMWLCTRDVQPLIDERMTQYNEMLTGSDQRQQVHTILTKLNDGIPVTWAETDWILESSDIDGNGTISRDEMRASVGWWFLHVARRKVQAERGWNAMIPWLCSAAIALICAYLVAATSVRFTEEKTQRWLSNTIIATIVKLGIIDPMKVLFCGTWLEPVAALFSLDVGLAEFDLSEAIGEAIEDMGEDGLDEVGIALAAQSLQNDSWDADIDKTAEEKRKDMHQNVFLGGSRSVAKMRGIAQTHQVKSHALRTATEAARDSSNQLQRMQSQRAEMNAVYAEKVAQKRLKQGKNRGTFAARAETDMIAVSQYMAAEQTHMHEQQRMLQREIEDLAKQEEQMLGQLKFKAVLGRAKSEGVSKKKLQQVEGNGDATILQQSAVVDLILEHAEEEMRMDQGELVTDLEMMRVRTPDDSQVTIRELNALRVLRDKKQRAEEKRDLLLSKRDVLDHEEGNERELLNRAKREGEEHERHISHLKGLANAKTLERVRRKQLAKRGQTMAEVLPLGKAANFLTRVMSSRSKVSVRAADAGVAADNAAPAGMVADEEDTLTNLALAQRGMHRSASRPKQLKVSVPPGLLPGTQVAAAAAKPAGGSALIEEINDLFPELLLPEEKK